MAAIQLVVLCVTLGAFVPCQARYCLSRCCDINEVNIAGSQLVSQLQSPKPKPSSVNCEAYSTGHVSERSTSPWIYEEHYDDTRFPSRIWHARCSCPRCIALRLLLPGEKANSTSWMGNSAVVNYTTLVFHRTPCREDPNRYNLVPEPYNVTVSCACVFPKRAK